jgi:hypothetical protein
MFLPVHKLSDEPSQSRMLNKSTIMWIFMGIYENLLFNGIGWQA